MNGSGKLGEERSHERSFIPSKSLDLEGERLIERATALRNKSKDQEEEIRELRTSVAHLEEQKEHYRELVNQAERGWVGEIKKGIKMAQTLKAKEKKIKSLETELKPLKAVSRISVAWWIFRLATETWSFWLYPLMTPLFAILSRVYRWFWSVVRTEMNTQADRHESDDPSQIK